MKIRPVEAKLFHADGRTDTTKLMVTFQNLRMCLKSSTHKIVQQTHVFPWSNTRM